MAIRKCFVREREAFAGLANITLNDLFQNASFIPEALVHA